MTNFSMPTDTLVKPDRLTTSRELEKKFGLDAQSIGEQAAALREHSDYSFHGVAASNTAAYPRRRILPTRRITSKAALASGAVALLAVVAGFSLLHFFSGHQPPQRNPVAEPTATAFTFAHADDSTGDFSTAAFAPALGRYIESDPIGLAGTVPGSESTYPYAANNPVTNVDPLGLSTITYDRNSGTITIYDNNGNQVGQYTAGNNTTSNSNGPWPNGTFPYSYYEPHPESAPNGPYGSNGNFIFDVPGRSGMGVHAGRNGPDLKTLGCIRTTNDATEFLKQLNSTDPLQTITVQ